MDDELVKASIDTAFAAQIGKLFGVLCTSLAANDSEDALEKFTAGLNCAKRARELARNAL